jgi:hypothetical protein
MAADITTALDIPFLGAPVDFLPLPDAQSNPTLGLGAVPAAT